MASSRAEAVVAKICRTRGKSSKSAGSGRTKQQLEKEKEAMKLRQELRKQVRDRRRNQQELNAARPTPEADIYICPFCEYENITGYKPRLIYEFEMKERKKRLEMERRQREQRNKEKARNRNRKGRKATKAAAATAGSSTQQDSLGLADKQPYDASHDNHDDTGQGTIDDDEYEDDDGAGEADDYVAELRLGIGDSQTSRLKVRDEEIMQQPIPAGS
ncbi:hypothetical protein SCUCBS95973_009825 [Sporothrix curviconia]|uniref:Uncharacterized protein n=1 Tax=Sporothrix curviconia TaxID=1260050 RepID=A0ABP0CZU1_9PEZI